MKFEKTNLGIILIEPDVHQDNRGFFLETFHEKKYREMGIPGHFVQDNHSKSNKGTLRGLHAQVKFGQGKLIRVVRGEIYDVGVDIREGSPTFGKWVATNLSEGNFKQIYIPAGFAHGFCVLSESAEVEYKCTDVYHPEDEISVLWNDKQIGIPWPLKEPIISKKDAAGKPLADLKGKLPVYGAGLTSTMAPQAVRPPAFPVG